MTVPDPLEKDAIQIRRVYRQKGLTPSVIAAFQKVIGRNYRINGRILPWRETYDPYRILVSEFMLQQTPVERVISYYPRFLERFPDFPALARSTIPEVMMVWKGLGYNRRALSLRETARIVVDEHHGILPDRDELLRKMPGIGKATAAALSAFAFGYPSVLLETNIRTVFIHFFFHESGKVYDRDIIPLIEATLPPEDPRGWYYSLMDYGVLLKKRIGNLNRHGAAYHTQPRFEGSDRQVRGKILALFLESPQWEERELQNQMTISPERLRTILGRLEEEGFLVKEGTWWEFRS